MNIKLAFVVVLLVPMVAWAGSAEVPKPRTVENIDIRYDRPSRRSSEEAFWQILETQMAEKLRTVVREQIAVPDGLTIHFVDSREEDLYYDNVDNQIVVSYRFLPSLEKQLKRLDLDMTDEEIERAALRFTQVALLLEFSYALLDKGDVFYVGTGQEQALPLMLVLLTESDKISNVDTFELLGQFLAMTQQIANAGDDKVGAFWRNRGLLPQPPYDEFCSVIGSDPTVYAGLAKGANYSPARVKSCVKEFRNSKGGWLAQLRPLFKNNTALGSL
ncbi:DUF4344 domain-containing metallopeptidase [Spongiibacter taiwanensis]|uniref:DUF4344 domain-containing metallopeptidase n=1 Tax=Spongiibacter taiwanensis TaxID=1748242 RepID=UPI0020356141|nr:DUF4344 domain-containing metallopeptidase [Spongiibacter taiwanensis]USA42120.1 DUF4344 domain-containing metallopeptidase [Spongiibacter taiwanensis]